MKQNTAQWPSIKQLGRAVYDELFPLLKEIARETKGEGLGAGERVLVRGRLDTWRSPLDAWMDSPCIVTVKLDGSNAGVDNKGEVVGRSTVIERGKSYQNIDIHALLEDYPEKAELVRQSIQHAIGLSKQDTSEGLDRVVLYGELCSQNKYDYMENGIYKDWLCFGAVVIPFSGDLDAPLRLCKQLRLAGFNASTVGRGDKRIILAPNRVLAEVFGEHGVRTVEGYRPQDIDPCDWNKHGLLPRFESMRSLLCSGWLRRFLVTPTIKGKAIGEGIVVSSEADGRLFKLKHADENIGQVPQLLQTLVSLLKRHVGTPQEKHLPTGILEVCEQLLEIATSKPITVAPEISGKRAPTPLVADTDAEASAAYESALTKFDDLSAAFAKGAEAMKQVQQLIIQQVCQDLEIDYSLDPATALRRARKFTLAAIGQAYGSWKKECASS